jgi:hypothetical protein
VFILDSLMVSGLKWVMKTVVTAAEAEMNDDTALREQLLEAEMRREMGEISDDEFEELGFQVEATVSGDFYDPADAPHTTIIDSEPRHGEHIAVIDMEPGQAEPRSDSSLPLSTPTRAARARRTARTTRTTRTSSRSTTS